MALRKRGYPEMEGGSLRKGGFEPWRKLWFLSLIQFMLKYYWKECYQRQSSANSVNVPCSFC